MKFSKLLDEYQLPEWRGTYIPYYFLKKRLADICDGRFADALRELSTRAQSVSRSPSQRLVPGTPPPSFAGQPDKSPAPHLMDKDLAMQAWLGALTKEVQRVDANVRRGLQELQQQFLDLMQLSQQGSTPEAQPTSMSHFMELNVMEALGRVAEGIYRLRGYAELNHAAVFKILRKHDKILKRDDGIAHVYPSQIENTVFADMSGFESLDASVREAFQQRSASAEPGITPEVALLAAGLGKRSAATAGLQGPALRAERLLFFFIGLSLALVLSIIVLMALPAKDPATFSKNYFLTSFPVFRVCLSLVLVIVGMATVARVCEDNFVNHFFILTIDPRCRISPGFLFTWAMLLSSAWILIFGMYVVDYKWMVLPLVWSSSTRLERASWHYVLYPVVLVGISFLLLVRPSSICRFRYKAQILRGVGRTCLAPFYAVSFCDNMIGDVLTSLAKPLRDVPAAICYLSSHHPQLQSSMNLFVRNGSTCPSWESFYVQPLIGGAPFWFRLLQCARRYHDTGQRRHLLNLGKYAASLLVVVVTMAGCATWILVVVSAIATAYAAIWDVTMDWGLGVGEMLFGRFNGDEDLARITSPLAETFDSPRSAVGSLHGSDIDLTRPGAARPTQPQRHFPRRVYCVAIVMDILLRLTWVLTLMPVNILSEDIIVREILHVFMTVAEIFRRTFWAILRIEYEQVANASGYRALLWVPMKVAQHAGDTEVRSAGRAARSTFGQRLL